MDFLKNHEIAGAIFIFLFGGVMHFMYDLSGRMKLVGSFVPVNESVWEHLKMVLWPALIYSIYEFSVLKNPIDNFWFAKAAGIYIAMIIIVSVFYTYTAFTGHSIFAVDILTFAVSIAVGQYISYMIMLSKDLPIGVIRLSLPLISLLILVFVFFTFYPPHLPVFKNPVDGSYGI